MKNAIFISLSVLMVLSGCAMQSDVISLDDRLAQSEQRYAEAEKKNKELQAKLDQYNKILAQDDEALRSKTASQHAMLDSLGEKIQILNGKLEETDYLLKQKIKTFEDLSHERGTKLETLDKAVSSNKDRIVRIEKYLNFESMSATYVKAPEKPIKGKLSEDEIYRAAKQAYDQGDFEAARDGFKKIVKQYPKSKNADNAQFWIGETYYREKWYEKAILEYQKVIEKYPKGNKMQASLLKQGFSFFNLGDKANARLILSELIKKYPKSNEAKIAKRKLKELTP